MIWINCKTYNVSGSEIYRSAEAMERKSKKLIKEVKVQLNIEGPGAGQGSKRKNKDGNLEVSSDEDSKKGDKSDDEEADEEDDFGFDPERYVPFTEKIEFADLIRRVTKEGLTQIVTYL